MPFVVMRKEFASPFKTCIDCFYGCRNEDSVYFDNDGTVIQKIFK
jgi:hypothetical protein